MKSSEDSRAELRKFALSQDEQSPLRGIITCLLDDLDAERAKREEAERERDAWKAQTREHIREYMTKDPDMRCREMSDLNGVLEAELDLAKTRLIAERARGAALQADNERMRAALEAVCWRGNIDEEPDDFNEAHAWWLRCDEIARSALSQPVPTDCGYGDSSQCSTCRLLSLPCSSGIVV